MLISGIDVPSLAAPNFNLKPLFGPLYSPSHGSGPVLVAPVAGVGIAIGLVEDIVGVAVVVVSSIFTSVGTIVVVVPVAFGHPQVLAQFAIIYV